MTNNQPELKACMPERIWLEENKDGYCDIKHGSGLKGTRTEYRRADLTPKWQSMDTAPRDGTWIIGYNKPERGNYVRRHVREIRWNGKSWGPFCTPTGITHWMPLPSCPADESGV
jgi:hypothetical protein